MKKMALSCAACLSIAILATPVLAQIPAAQIKPYKAKILLSLPRINSVSQEFYTLAINLVVTGVNFPARTGGEKYQAVRLASTEGGYEFLASGNRTWSATRIEDFLSFNTIAGRKYKIGLVEYNPAAPANKTLLSNEVEYLLLMNLDHVVPHPVPAGVTTVEVYTANELGPQGSKKVKLGSHQAQVEQWGGGNPWGGRFILRIPPNLARPGSYELFVEENGIPVSRKIQVQLQ